MTLDRWRRLLDLFHDLSDLPPEERNSRLQAIDDPAVREEVEALLRADADPPDILGADVGDLASLVEDPLASLDGRHVGPYRVIEEVGMGGMGTVYRAEHEEIGRTVALKLMRMPFASSDHVRRFLFERRLLSRLDHRSIARLLDAGTTRHGLPYFAMEFVGGRPITEHCDTASLSIDDRISLFTDVCRAVAHAHRNLVVHRDLKPSNVLVTPTRDVKLLDFGIAKLLSPASAEDTATRLQRSLFTPAYAAPEQIRGEAITTATDVYALGVLLFEMLAGSRPYHLGDAAPADIERIVCEAPISSMASVVTDAAAEKRQTTASALRRGLQGDLDAVVQTALAKEPDRRYASATELLDDLRRIQTDQPIRARSPTAGYHLQKFVLRHRAAVGGVALAALLLTALIGVYTVQLQNERERAQAALERAEREAATSERVTELIANLLQAGDPSEQPVGDTLLVPELLQQGLDEVATLDDEPAVQGRLLATIGRVQLQRGQFETADSLLRHGLHIQTQVLGPDDPGLDLALTSIAQLAEQRDRFDRADSLHRRVLAIRETHHGRRHPDVAESLHNLGTLRVRQGDYAEAERLLRDALDLRVDLLGPGSPGVASTRNNLAVVMRRTGRAATAESLYVEALQASRSALGPEHPDVAMNLHNLAQLRVDMGKLESADTLFQKALRIRRTAYGPDHPRVAMVLTNYGNLKRMQGKPDSATALIRDALQIRRAHYATNHHLVASSLNDLALVYRETGAFGQAEELQQEVLAIYRQQLGPDHSYTAAAQLNLGLIRQSDGRCEEAIDPLERALENYRSRHGIEHRSPLIIQIHLGECLVARGSYARAESLLVVSRTGLLPTLPDDDPRLERVRTELAALYRATGRSEKAEALASEANAP